jgi:hypothetical protein
MLAVVRPPPHSSAWGLALVLIRGASRRGFKIAVAAAIAFGVVALGLAVAGAIRWRGCSRAATGAVIRDTGQLDPDGTLAVERCSEPVLGMRDPFWAARHRRH